MPFASSIRLDPDLHHVRFWGMLTLAETRRQFARAPKLAGFYPGIPTLLDMRGLTGTEMALADLMSLRDRLVERHSRPGQVMKFALLVDNDMAFGIARIFDTLCSQADSLDVGIFHEPGEACAHLGLTAAALDTPPLAGNGPRRT